MLFLSPLAQADAIEQCLNHLAVKRAHPTGPIVHPTMQFRLANESEMTARCDEQGDMAGIRKALRYQVARCAIKDVNDKPQMKLGCKMYQRDEWCTQTNKRMLEIANASPDVRTYLNRIRLEFDWYKSLGFPQDETRFKKGDVQFTGYFTPVLQASRVRQGAFQYPVYATPPELVQIPDNAPANCGVSLQGRPMKWCRKNPNGTYSPFYTRREIENGALANRNLIFAYLADPIELDSMMIQGSAKLEVLEINGTKTMVAANFGAKNGRTLRMLGSVVKCGGGRGSDYSNIEGIKRFLKADPVRARKLMSYDQSYVFFKPEAEGPYGSEKVPVVGRHSVAVDRDLVPPGASMLIDVNKFGGAPSCPRISTFALAQDTGGAIRGAHVDWYFGAGKLAGDIAGKMNNAGGFYVAVPRGAGKSVCN